MTAITLQDVSVWTGRESVYLYLVGLTKATARNLFFWVFFPILLPMTFIVAQAFPFKALQVVRRINGMLPDVQDEEVLELVHDLYQLLYSAAEFYGHLCLFRGKLRTLLDELDETLDSLRLVREHKRELQQFLQDSEDRRVPDLPLFKQAAL